MRIGISLLNFRPGAVGGIETFIRNVIEHAPPVAGGDDVLFFVNRSNRQVVPSGFHVVEVPWSQFQTDVARVLEAFTPWRARSVESLIAHHDLDVLFFTQQSMFPKCCPVPSVLLVADLQYLITPAYYSRFDRAFRARAYIKSIHRCSAIISISRGTADHLTTYCGIPPEKIDVVHHGFDPVRPTDSAAGILPPGVERPYLYYPAFTYPHKGHARLIKTFAHLKRSGRIGHKLVFSGGRNTWWKTLERQIRQEGMEQEILHVGFVSRDQVEALYNEADAVLFPTEFEGFGIPVLEAAGRGKKIICSRLPIFDELGVSRESQIEFAHPEELLHALKSNAPVDLISRHLTWEESLDAIIDILRRVVVSSQRDSS